MSSVFGALVPPVELVPVTELGAVHFIAVGGAGMSGIAAAYAQSGVIVSGSDRSDSATLRGLAEYGVRTYVGHAAEQLGAATTVVVSSAIPAANVELAAARERGLRIWHRSAALGALMLGRRGIAIGGTHGKTTTSGMLAHLLTEVGADPGFVIGAPLATTGASWRLGSGPFVVEADESDGSFLQYPAEVAVVTNIEADHLDNWGTVDAYHAGFAQFLARARTTIGNVDDPNVRQLAPLSVGFGAGPGADVELSHLTLTGFGASALLGGVPLKLQVPGWHNLQNAAAAVLAAEAVGIDRATAAAAMAGFRGTHRRFMRVGQVNGIDVIDDYAHHPTEITATLDAARTGVQERGGRVVACFQPHLFSRTRDFAAEFGTALAAADEVILLDIYPAREVQADFPGVTSELLADHCRAAGGSVRLVPRGELAATAAGLARPGDVVLTLGAGDITELAPDIVKALQAG
ncbi:UDP-N-acetylmuramate--L-alanine ligase [Granulicoccus phenolivorans]|uniref:UDP-N-acetylmuramate--L-alanine ligase n=1 Tax=Granulicoccus phenolivorans TaxID=266854 RepID=UPI0004022246|nr:UDP-N-acetylmuramate--L-alanine ligase [Granulicoccus phenolivorans]